MKSKPGNHSINIIRFPTPTVELDLKNDQNDVVLLYTYYLVSGQS